MNYTKDILRQLLDKAITHYELDSFSDLSIIMTSPKNEREKLCELLFEEFEVKEILLQSQEVFGLLDCRRWTGISVHLGGGYSSVVPYYMGCEIYHASTRYY